MNNDNKNAILTVLKDDAGVINKIGFYASGTSVGGSGFYAVADITWSVSAGYLTNATPIDFTGNIGTPASPGTITISKIGLFSTDVVGTTLAGTPITELTLDNAVKIYDLGTSVMVELDEILRLTTVEFGVV